MQCDFDGAHCRAGNGDSSLWHNKYTLLSGLHLKSRRTQLERQQVYCSELKCLAACLLELGENLISREHLAEHGILIVQMCSSGARRPDHVGANVNGAVRSSSLPAQQHRERAPTRIRVRHAPHRQDSSHMAHRRELGRYSLLGLVSTNFRQRSSHLLAG